MKNIRAVILLSFIFSLLLVGCANASQAEKFPEDQEAVPELLGDAKEAIEVLNYGFNVQHIDDTAFYYNDGIYHYTLDFNKDVTREDNVNFQAYFESTFLYFDVPAIGITTYPNELIEAFNSEERPFTNLSLRVYIDGNKAYRTDYNFDERVIMSEYIWENPNINYDFNVNKHEAIEDFINKHQKSDNSITIKAEKAFVRDNTLILKIDSKKDISAETLATLKSNINDNLKPTLRAYVLDMNPHSFRYNRILLIIRKKGQAVEIHELSPKNQWQSIAISN